jgi:uncharacterized protein (DUF697 family)/tellurite resistance protein
MNLSEQNAILSIALFAAFADGSKDEREREQIRQLADTLGAESGSAGLPKLYQDVLLKRITLAGATAALSDPSQRQLAYEMAVCVCDADGRQSDAERRFLAELQALLGLDAGQAAALSREADQIAELADPVAPGLGGGAAAAAVAGVAGAAALGASVAASATPSAGAAGPVVLAVANVPESELDASILRSSILNGALELLPQSWASLAIIPLQIKLVYKIGKAYGVELDQGHIKEFLATAGVGLTSQYLEQFGRKLIGGLLGKVAGGLVGKVGGAATGMAFSFATTYALGQIAKRYYAGGRQMSSAALRETFQSMLGPAKELQSRYLPEIRQTAGGLDAGKVMAMVRGT